MFDMFYLFSFLVLVTFISFSYLRIPSTMLNRVVIMNIL